MWIIQETPQFEKSCKDFDLSEEVIEKIKDWAKTEHSRIQTSRNKRYFVSPTRRFEIWVAGLPEKDRKKGKSGGFRLIYYFVLEDSTVFLDRLERRGKIGFKRERPKEKEKFEKYLRDLKKYLLETLEKLIL